MIYVLLDRITRKLFLFSTFLRMFSAYFVLAVLLGMLGITEASAQAQKPRLFYFVTKDNNFSQYIYLAGKYTNERRTTAYNTEPYQS